jgi:signal transduction histidine kinase
VRASVGFSPETVAVARFKPGEGYTGWVFAHQQPLIVSNVKADPRTKPIDLLEVHEERSALCVPLIVQDRTIGTVTLDNVSRYNAFTPEHLDLLTVFANQVAVAIENARLYERAQQEIAERVRAEEALRQHAAKLQARNEELDAFAHTVAHDLKNPLGYIVGFAEALEESYATMPGEESRRYLHTMAQSGRKMGRIIDELLLLACVRKVTEVEMDLLDTASIVAEAQGRLALMIEEHQAEIILPDTWPVALGYGPWIEEVWVNYLSNAIKYGGQPPRVELGATVQPDGMVRFWVRDNGPGLLPEEQTRLFTLFTRLDQVRAKGHGLGLSIARRIVEKLGGQVGIESEIGKEYH